MKARMSYDRMMPVMVRNRVTLMFLSTRRKKSKKLLMKLIYALISITVKVKMK
jgi:predicted nucleic acid-binding Zn ribbon protein